MNADSAVIDIGSRSEVPTHFSIKMIGFLRIYMYLIGRQYM